MTDKELADKAAKILGQHAPFFASEWKAPEFVNDWRVAGPLMEKTIIKCGHTRGMKWGDIFNTALENWEMGASFSRSLIEASVEALENE